MNWSDIVKDLSTIRKNYRNDMMEMANRFVVAIMDSKGLYESDHVLATLLDMCVEYTDDPTTEPRRKIIAKAINSLLDYLEINSKN